MVFISPRDTEDKDSHDGDAEGKKVPAGKYFIKLEGTLYAGSNVVYIGTVDLAASSAIEMKMERSEPANNKNATMLQNVKMSVK